MKTNKLIFCVIIISIIIFLFFGKLIGLFTSTRAQITAIIIGVLTSIFAGIFMKIISHSKLSDSEHVIKSIPDKQKKWLDLDSKLPATRKEEIVKWRLKYYPYLIKLRQEHFKKVHKKQKYLDKKEKNKLMREPAWFSIASTDSKSKRRLNFGFKNIGCSYWRKNDYNIGCLNCGYASSVNHLIEKDELQKEDLIAQLNKVLSEVNKINFDVIDFSSDGSFFNENEYPKGFHKNLLKKIGDLQQINRILIESRPEYITKNTIDKYLHFLNSKQEVEIAIGLETRDNFISKVCINKNFYYDDFEKALRTIENYSPQCSVVVYIIVKPAFLSELEAFEDVISTLQYLKSLKDKYNVVIKPKLEPGFIPAGTILDFLHFYIPFHRNEWYDVPSYWCILEIICHAFLIDLHENLRIGAREDMSLIRRYPGIYNEDGTFNQYDFWVYDAIQQYNENHDMINLLADIKYVLEEDQDSNSFKKWKTKIGIDNTAIEKCLDKFEDNIKELRGIFQDCKYNTKQKIRIEREEYLSQIFGILDEIELRPDSVQFAAARKKENLPWQEKIKIIESFLNKKFSETINDFHVKAIKYFFEENNHYILRVNFELIYVGHESSKFGHQGSRNIWVGIPTKIRPNFFKKIWKYTKYHVLKYNLTHIC